MAIKKPVIRRPLPPVQPPIEPREELPPIAEEVEPLEVLVEELPPVEPVELYPLIARLYPSFPTLKPEELQTKMAELSSWAQEDPEAFLYDLDLKATPEERDIVLRTLGVPEEYFVARELAEETAEAQEARITGLVAGVYPDLALEEFVNYLETDFESFLNDMQTGGMTKEKLALLRGMGLPFQSDTELDIQDFFQQIKVFVEIDDVRQQVTITPEGRAYNARGQWIGTYNHAAREFTVAKTDEGFVKEGILDPLKFGIKTTWHRMKQFYASVVPELLYPPMPDWYPEPMRDFMNETNRQMRDGFRKVYALNQSDYDAWVVKHPELIPKPEWEEGWSEHPELILNPAYMAYEFSSTAPVTVSVMATVIGTQLLTHNPLLAMWAGMNLMVPQESADVYEALLNAGAPEGQAPAMALFVGTCAGLIETLSDLFVLKVVAPGVAGLFRKEALKEISKVTVAYALKKGVTTFTQVEAIEIAEELLTQAITNAALKVYDENVEIWDDLVRTAAKTFAAVLPIAVFGGATTTIAISRQQATQFTDAEKIEKGWTKDPATDNWFRPMTPEEITAKLEEGKVVVPEEPPLMTALMKEGAELVAATEKIEPTNTSLVQFKEYLKQAQEAVTPEARGEALAGMEGLEDTVRAIAKLPEVFMTEEMWEGMPVPSRAKAAREAGLEGKVGSKAWEDLTVAEKRALTGLKPEEIPRIEVAPEVVAERAISAERTETINTLAKEKLIMTEEGKTKPQLRRLMKALTGKNRINQLTNAEADLVIDAVGRLEVKYGRPPVIPTGVGLITAEFADKIPLLKEIGILEKVRPTRHVFEKMGLRQEVWKPAFEAEVRVYEEHQVFDKELVATRKLVDKGREIYVFRELENPGSQVGLTFNEKRAVTWFRKYFNEWADRLELPQEKRRKNYVTHIFEEEISRELKEKHPMDPELVKAMEYITPKTVFNPYLQKRLGQKQGLKEDPFAAASAYGARALKVFYYEPLIQRIRVYQKYLPPHSAKYLKDFITRITDRPLTIDREMNHTVKEFVDWATPIVAKWIPKVGKPAAQWLNEMARGNPGGLVSYNLTSVLYTLWLGFKPTSAIRNLSQHILIIAETGPINFAKGIGLRVTQEGRSALKESLVLRSRRGAFIPAIDSSFAGRWTDSFREKALWMFRQADKQNVSDAFLAGYSEAKEIFPNAPRQLWIDRGDEVAADTQYLYTKFNSFSMSQNSIGRVFSMLTTWAENWLELMYKWARVRPSQIYLSYTKETGQAMPTKNWSQTRKAILMYMLIIGLGYVVKEKTRLKAWEYTGLTSLDYLAGISGGEFPALEVTGAVGDIIVGFVTDDERQFKTGWNGLQRTLIPSIIRQMDYIATGERDWLTLLLYLEGKDIEIKRLKNKWEGDWKEYPVFETPEEKLEYIRAHPKQAGWSEAKIRNQWREDNPSLEAQMFIVGKFTTLSSDGARAEVLRLIEEHKIDTELIDGYEKVFGVDTQPELQGFQDRLGNLEKFVIGEEAEYFTTSNFATEVNRLVNIQGRSKVERDGNKLAIEYLHAMDLWEPYYNFEEDDARTLWRQQYPDVEALLYLFGKVSSFKNPKSAEILLGLMKKYNIPPQAIRAFIDKPERYDELFTQKFGLEQKWFDQTTEYENFGNTEAPNYIEDAELRKETRAKFKEDNPNWVADMRRIEAIDNDASDEIMERWVDRGKTIDEFGAGSSQAKAWLLDNPEAHKWALEKELLTDDGSDWNEPVLRLNVKWHELDNRYEGFGDKLSEFYIEDDDARAEAREKLLATNADYRKDRYRRDAYGIDFPEIENYVTYYELDAKGFRQERMLLDNPDFAKAMHTIAGIDLPEAGKVPVVQYDEIYEKWQGDFDKLEGLSDHESPHYIENVDRREKARQTMRIDKKGNLTEFGIAEIRRNGYGKLVPEKHIEGYVTYYSIIAKGKPANYEDINKTDLWYEDDWALIENPEFYQEIYLDLLENEPKKLGLVPTRKIFDKYLEYVKLPKGKRRDDFRWENQDLDAWLVLKFDMVPIAEKRRRAELTPTEEFLEYVLEKETEFDEAMRELEELLAGLR